MPVFATLFTGIFTSIAAFVGQFVARKYAVIIAGLGVLGAVTIAFYGVISGLLNGMVALLPNEPGIDLAIWFAVPEVVPVAVGAALSVDTACAVFQWNKEQIKMMMY